MMSPLCTIHPPGRNGSVITSFSYVASSFSSLFWSLPMMSPLFTLHPPERNPHLIICWSVTVLPSIILISLLNPARASIFPFTASTKFLSSWRKASQGCSSTVKIPLSPSSGNTFIKHSVFSTLSLVTSSVLILHPPGRNPYVIMYCSYAASRFLYSPSSCSSKSQLSLLMPS